MWSRARSVWLIVLLLCAAVAPAVFDAAGPSGGWEQVDDDALPVAKQVSEKILEQTARIPERRDVLASRFGEVEIFRPPIG